METQRGRNTSVILNLCSSVNLSFTLVLMVVHARSVHNVNSYYDMIRDEGVNLAYVTKIWVNNAEELHIV